MFIYGNENSRLFMLYKDIISLEELCEYESVFHLTLEIQKFKLHEYSRVDVAKEICSFFNIYYPKLFVPKNNDVMPPRTIDTISIFPIMIL